MNICYISSDKYAPYMGTSLFSLLDNNKEAEELNLYVFDIDINTDNKQKIREIAHNYGRNVVFVSENERMNEIVREYGLSSFCGTTSTYVKIFPYLFLPTMEKVLIIDCDTIVTQGLSELYDTDIQNAYLAAVPEILAYYRSSEDPEIIHKNEFYYNSGVILWNLAKAKSDNFERKFFSSFQKYGKPLKLADQSLLNLSLDDEDIIPLNFKFNFNNNLNYLFSELRPQVMSKYEESGLGIPRVSYNRMVPGKAVVIIHFLGAYRPWIKWRMPPLSGFFLKYWRKGPWKSMKRESYLDEVMAEKMRRNPSSIMGSKYVGRFCAAVYVLLSRYCPGCLKIWSGFKRKAIRFCKKLCGLLPASKSTVLRQIEKSNQVAIAELKRSSDEIVQRIIQFSKIQEAVDISNEQIANLYKLEESGNNASAEFQNKVNANLAELQSTAAELQKQMLSALSTIYVLRQNEHLVNVGLERNYYKDFLLEPSQDEPDFEEKFLNLTSGLDQKSVETVVKSLRRLQRIRTVPHPFMPLYSAEEKDEMREVREGFFDEIVKLSDGCFFWRGYMLPSNNFEVSVFINLCGIPYLEAPERLKGKDIIDGGAFIGDSALILSQYTDKRVYAFEPVPSNYERMLKTIRMNSLTNVMPCPFALGEKRGKLSLSLHNSCSTQFENSAFSYEGTVDAEVITLDEFVQEHNLSIGLIKTDVEGAEQLLLRGAMQTIKTQKPSLIISIYHNSSDFFDIKPMLESLGLGYKFKIRHPVGGTVMTEMILIAET